VAKTSPGSPFTWAFWPTSTFQQCCGPASCWSRIRLSILSPIQIRIVDLYPTPPQLRRFRESCYKKVWFYNRAL
jgi:hypothetical protein